MSKVFVIRLDFYFANLKLFWPYDLYKYSEDQALNYLVKYNYDIELTLAMISKWTLRYKQIV